MRNLKQNIRLLRHQQGWSQEDVAIRLNISIPAFSKIETGITDINLSRLEQLAAVFSLSVIQLLTFNDDEESSNAAELQAANLKLLQREIELNDLQKKVIELFEELRR
ncbi:helix-turn-helix domain-containing protein [Mucilaginibacter kameinonensis]|uniref:helix-turn-helix domain-containing protein n=1 Tax=Mucilaginibacter kameinonensis TaxID=452286 RepID=UPI000EF75F2F|nr:helix-turn-helix transcriptional regulator [Mucilaginibacter kameinonensis]